MINPLFVGTGYGAPASTLGVNTNYYLRSSNGDVYQKSGGVWAVVGNILGLGAAAIAAISAINGIVKCDGAGNFTAVTDNSANWNTVYATVAAGAANWNAAYSNAVAVAAINGLIKGNGAGAYSAVADNSANWNTAYGWGNHAAAGYLVNPMTTNGDMITRAGGVTARVGIGTNGFVWTVVAGAPAWAAASGGGITIGTTAITSGGAGNILFENGSNKVGESANLTWDTTNNTLVVKSSGAAQGSQIWKTSGGTTIQKIGPNGGCIIGDVAGDVDTNAWVRIKHSGTADVSLAIRSVASNTADYIQIMDSTATANIANVFKIDKDGNLKLLKVGAGFYIAEGSNGKMGGGTLVGGTVTINTTKIGANCRVFCFDTGGAALANVGTLAEDLSARVNGTSFTIKSTNPLDVSTFNWVIFEIS